MTFKEYTLRIPRNTLLYMSHFLSISANESFRAAAEEVMYKVLKHYAEQCKFNSSCFIKFNLSKNKSGETFTLKCRLVQGQIQECYILKVSKGLKSEHLSKFKEQFFQRIEKVCQVSQQVRRVCVNGSIIYKIKGKSVVIPSRRHLSSSPSWCRAQLLS